MEPSAGPASDVSTSACSSQDMSVQRSCVPRLKQESPSKSSPRAARTLVEESSAELLPERMLAPSLASMSTRRPRTLSPRLAQDTNQYSGNPIDALAASSALTEGPRIPSSVTKDFPTYAANPLETFSARSGRQSPERALMPRKAPGLFSPRSYTSRGGLPDYNPRSTSPVVTSTPIASRRSAVGAQMVEADRSFSREIVSRNLSCSLRGATWIEDSSPQDRRSPRGFRAGISPTMPSSACQRIPQRFSSTKRCQLQSSHHVSGLALQASSSNFSLPTQSTGHNSPVELHEVSSRASTDFQIASRFETPQKCMSLPSLPATLHRQEQQGPA